MNIFIWVFYYIGIATTGFMVGVGFGTLKNWWRKK